MLTSYAKSIDVLNQLITSLQGGMLVVSIILVMMALLFWIGGRTHDTDMFMQTIKTLNVQVKPEEVWLVILVGLAIVLFAIITTSLIIARYKPRGILSKLS